MIEVSSLAGRPVPVMGLGKSGVATARALMKSGAEPWAWDDSAARRAEAAAQGIPLVDLHRKDLAGAAGLVLSPGIPHSFPAPHPVAARARAAGLEIVCDVELLGRSRRAACFIGITGTNGKSTTTALIGHILALAGRRMQVGGNLGTPALALDPLGEGGLYVLELSSYQLELIHSITFDVAVLTNISADHLDRHGGMQGYIAAKRRIFDRQAARHTAVIGVDDEHARALCAELRAAGAQTLVPVSAIEPVERGAYVLAGRLIDHTGRGAQEIADLTSIPTLLGRHNWQNAAAAYATARALGVPAPVIVGGLRSFPGLAHRQELVAVIDDVRYVNDSKATNADAAEKALVCYDRIYWIAGGRPKEGGIEGLGAHFHRIRHAYLIGEAAPAFARTLEGRVPYTLAGTLEVAVRQAQRDAGAAAAKDAAKDAVVLLSPACASWDQFANFEARGEAFRALVDALTGRRDGRPGAEASP